MSPGSISSASASVVCSANAAGTITQAALGFESLFTKSSSEPVPIEPSLSSWWTESALTS